MTDRLRRNTTPSHSRNRYGTWKLSSDDKAAARQEPSEEQRMIDDWLNNSEEDVRHLMRRQWRLSVTIALLIYGTTIGVIVLSFLLPEVMGRAVWHGFSPSFLFAAVLIYPFTLIAAVVYTLISNRLDGLD